MTKAVGIDLGTTNSVIAHITGKNTPKVLDNQESDQWTPSLVFADESGEFLIGKLAKASAEKSPENLIFSIKRFMGRDYEDEDIKPKIESGRFPYAIAKDQKGEVTVQMRNRWFSPPEVSAMILESLKKDGEAGLDEEISHAVITVPAYFGTRQKEVTRLAGRLAGLNVLRVLPEPTAAALAYGMDIDMDEPKTVLVYDLGGGTFDVTVMFIGGGTFMDQGKSGDIYLGGDDFDNLIVDRLVKVVQDQHRVDVRTLPNSKQIMLHMKYKAEEAKIRLSKTQRSPIVIPGLIRSGGKVIDVEYDLERGEFNSLIQGLVQRSIDIVYKGIKKANTTIDDIDTILLVGGSTRVPLVEDELRKVFGEKVARKDVNPMLCVAQGAAIQTLMVAPEDFESQTDPNIIQCKNCGVLNIKDRSDCRCCGKEFSGAKPVFVPEVAPQPTMECPNCGYKNILGDPACKNCGEPLEPIGGGGFIGQKLSRPIGIELEGGAFEIILNDDMSLPTDPTTSLFHTSKADQRSVVMPIYEGDNPVAKKNQYLGSVEGDLPSGLPIKTDVNVTLQADINGTLKVNADVPSRPDVKIEATLNWKDTPQKPEVEGSVGDDSAPQDWKNEAMMVRFMGAAVREEGRNILVAAMYNPIVQLAEQLELAIQINDEPNGRKIMAQLKPLVERMIFVTVALGKIIKQDPELARKIGRDKAEQLASVLNRLDVAHQAGRGDEYLQIAKNELEGLINEILPNLGGGNLTNLLQKSSSIGK